MTPIEALRRFYEQKIDLAPPQHIILNIMSSFTKFEYLNEYLKGFIK